MTTRVSFLVAGVQKGGTSALRGHLRRASAINMPAGELHYFDNGRFLRGTVDHAAYEARFDDAALAPRRVNVGDADVDGARLETADVDLLRAIYAEDEAALAVLAGVKIPRGDPPT